jgi:hypothetical protein
MKKVLLFLLFGFIYQLYAQNETGSISGKVVDLMSEQPLIGVTIIVSGTTFGSTTDQNGEFIINNVPVGSYQLKASAIGYETIIKPDIIVNSVRPVSIDFALKESVIQIQDVTVTSDYFQKDPHQVTSVTSFSYEEIRRAPGGFEDVIRALSILPGVAQADAGRNDLIVRGGAPSENLYIVDGFMVPNINHFGSQGATGGPLSYINLDYVKETTFSTGGFSAMYGDKLSSVLKIDLRDGRSDRIGGKATISATQFGLDAEGPLNKNSNFILSARRSYLDLIFKAAGFGFVPEYYDLLTKYSYKFDNSNSLSYLFVSAFDNVRYFNDTQDQRYDNSRTLGSNQIQYLTGVQFRHLFNNGFYNISLSRNFVDYKTSQRDSMLNYIFQNNSREAENVLNGDLVYKLSPTSEINIGAFAKLILFNADLKLPDFITTFGDTLNVNKTIKKSDFLKFGFYSQYSDLIASRFKVNLGIRLDYFNEITNKLNLSPRFAISYLLSDITSINFSTGIYYQNPSYIWLTGNEINKNLKSIRADHYVLGLENRLDKDLLLKIEGFYKNYKNYPASTLRKYLVLANTGAGFAGAEDNFSSFGLEPLVSDGKGDVKGVELLLQKKSSDSPYYGIFSLTFSKSYFTALDGIRRIGSYDQKWIINLSGGYIFDEKWELSSKFRFSTGKPFTPFNPDGSQNVLNYNLLRLDANHSLDVRLDRRWNFNNWMLITYIDIQNIYNHRNIGLITWDERTKQVDKEASIGILPSIGISIEI